MENMNLSFKELPSEQITWNKEIKQDEANKQTIMTGKFTANGKEYVITVKYSSTLALNNSDKKVHEVLQNEFKTKFESKEIDTQALASLAGKSIRFNANQEKKWELLNEKGEQEAVTGGKRKIFDTISTVFSRSFGVEVTKKDDKGKEELLEDEGNKKIPPNKPEVSPTTIELKKIKQASRNEIVQNLNEEEAKLFEAVEDKIKKETWLLQPQKNKEGESQSRLQQFYNALSAKIALGAGEGETFTSFVNIEPEGTQLPMSVFLGIEGEVQSLLERGDEISLKYVTGALCHLAKKHKDVQVVDYNNPERKKLNVAHEEKLNVEKPKKILMPFWISKGHFILYTYNVDEYDVDKNELKRYDSSPTSTGNTTEHDANVAKAIQDMLELKNLPEVKTQEVPGQVMNDCGMHVYKNAGFFLEDKEIPDAESASFDLGKQTDFNRERFNILLAVLGQDPVE